MKQSGGTYSGSASEGSLAPGTICYSQISVMVLGLVLALDKSVISFSHVGCYLVSAKFCPQKSEKRHS